MSFTLPSVSFPECWSFFNTIKTCKPVFIFAGFVPSMLPLPLRIILASNLSPKSQIAPICLDINLRFKWLALSDPVQAPASKYSSTYDPAIWAKKLNNLSTSQRAGCGSYTGILRGPTRLHDTIYDLTCRQLGHAEIVCSLQVNPRLCIRAEVPRQT